MMKNPQVGTVIEDTGIVIDIDRNLYILSIGKDKVQSNKYINTVYTCILFDLNHIQVDNFKVIYSHKDRLFWSWTANLMTQIDKIKLREHISSLFNKGVIKMNYF